MAFLYSFVRLKDPFCVRKCHLQQRLMQDQNNNENPSIHYHFPDTEYSTCRCYSVSALLDAAGITWLLRCEFRWFYEDRHHGFWHHRLLLDKTLMPWTKLYLPGVTHPLLSGYHWVQGETALTLCDLDFIRLVSLIGAIEYQNWILFIIQYKL